ncbi:hypothetical protein O6H91_02G124800 [Diphasiastrum complanatum]|uniref:Uncharacterized protein n=1 Tax=Diphasiastrum complanatum TaxID=34168 RepID=A0ACC2EKN3_DIPCM|nr:hypothetical protein O6H91_02G124800 [Diphasiastrum complanatum]
MSFSDKEKWIKDRPYTAIPNLRYALSKYPHRQSVYTNMHEKISQNLADELEKFGISHDAEGISDDKFAAATAALEKQRTARFSSAPASERTVMEYERSTILWHIERAVHTRDMDMIESIFDGEPDSGSEASNGQINLSDIDLNNEEGRQLAVTIDERTSSRRKGSRQENRNSCVEPESGSEGSDVDQRTKEHRKSGLAEAQLQYASKEFFWKTDEEPETQTFRVTGQVLAQRIKSPIADQHHFILSPVESPKGMDKNEDEQAEDSLGLGEWESEDGKNIISPKSMSLLYAMRRGVFIDHDGIASPRSSNEQAPQTSKLTGRLRVEGMSKANRADRESKHQKETESAIGPTYPTKVQL